MMNQLQAKNFPTWPRGPEQGVGHNIHGGRFPMITGLLNHYFPHDRPPAWYGIHSSGLMQPGDPIQEEIDPVISQCQHQVQVPVISVTDIGPPRPEEVEVVRTDNPTQAYQRIRSRGHEIPLYHGGPSQWGSMFMGIILYRGITYYYKPPPENVERVMIKRFFKSVVDNELRNGSMENPHKEIYRMQQLAGAAENAGFVKDAHANKHVLGCIDALEDETYLYIITPFCQGESLLQHVPLQPTENVSAEAKARPLFLQMLQNVLYLHNLGICHRDIDPGNMLVRDDGRIVFNDLAMSFKMPASGLLKYMGGYGKAAYFPPEVLRSNRAYDARQCDLWATAITLWNLVTGIVLYHYPHPDVDFRFKYAIMAEGLSPRYANIKVRRVLHQATRKEFEKDFIELSDKIISLSPELLELFHGVLHWNPNKRWNMKQILECDWMNMHL